MPRDHRKLDVFRLAHDLISDLYAATATFPDEERYGLQAQVRRAGVSVVTNIAEGSARRTTAEYLRFLEIAFGSAREVVVLLDIAVQLGMLTDANVSQVVSDYDRVLRKLAGIIKTLSNQP